MSNLIKAIIGLLIVLIQFSADAQSYSTKNKKAIGFYQEAHQLAGQRRFDAAIKSLEQAIDKDPKFAEAHLMLGSIHKLLLNPVKAKDHYLAAAELKPESKEMIPAYLVVGEYFFNEGNYEKSLEYFNRINSLNPNQKAIIAQTNKYISNANFALEAKKKPLEFKPHLMDPYINKHYMQAFPVVTADGKYLIYSMRAGPRPQDSEEIVICENIDGRWSEPKSISANINTPYNEGACSISGDGRTLVFASCRRPDGTSESCDLYVSYKEGDQWTKPVNMGTNVNTVSWESEPSISSDGRYVYFTSDRQGGLGKDDIYYTFKNEDGEWQPARNIGAPINTQGREVSPFIHANGQTLFFSSDYHPGFGGFDIFYTQITDSFPEQPKNVGYPINNQINNISLFITADGKKGYYSEDKREGTAMNYTRAFLYEFEIPSQINLVVHNNSYAKGKVFDAVTKKPIAGTVELIELKTNRKVQSVISDSTTGEYILVLNQGKQYGLFASKKGYLYKSLTFNFSDSSKITPAFLDLYLDPIKAGKSTTLNNIFFASNSFELDPLSKTEIDKIINLLKTNPSVKVEFGGHTDNIGSDAENLALSEKRAKSVYDYIINLGIDKARLKYKGFGESQPINNNNTEEARASNRRIEFKVL